MTYTTIFFDWGGVVADDPGDDFLNQILIECGADEGKRKEIFATYMKSFMAGKLSETDYWNLLRSKYDLSIEDAVSARFMDWPGLKASQKVLEKVKDLRGSGYKVAILSNVIEPSYNAIERSGYYAMFDDVIASCKVGCVKPDVKIYDIALKRLGSEASESIFIDDKERCLIPAKELGFSTIKAESSQQFLDDLDLLIK